MANKYMKNAQNHFAIKEIQIKTMKRYHFTPTRMAIIKRRILPTSIGKDVEKLEHSYATAGNGKWCSHFGKQSGTSLKG